MISLDALIGVAGCLVEVLVVAAMILRKPRGAVDLHAKGTDADDSKPSPARMPEEPLRERTAA